MLLACKSLSLKEGDLFWTVPNSFVATANCGILSGLKIDFIDIDPETWNISLDKLEHKLKIAKRKKKLPTLIIVVHLGGLPTDPIKLKNLSKKYKFKIIEDASHSFGGKYYSKRVGCSKWSDISVFSFHPVKIITTGEGGCCTTNVPIKFQKVEKNIYSTYHLFIIKLDVKYQHLHKIFFNYLRSKKLLVNLHYLPIHLQPFYRKLGFKEKQFAVAEEYSKTAISIPIYPNLKKKEQIKIINYIKYFFNNYA